MPVDAMLLLSSSPTLLSCSPPYSTYSHYSSNINKKRQSDLNIQMAPLYKAMHSLEIMANSGPLRSCLRTHKDTADASSVMKKEVRRMSASNRTKKNVCFADCKGLALAQVKVMNESSDTPPTLNPLILRMITQDALPQPSFTYKYVPCFDQPASKYLQFRERLKHKNVCLENIIVKDNLIVMGTLKVKNISYEKKVFLRTTFDQWKSFSDFSASFVQSVGSSVHSSSEFDKYNTFSFQFNVPTNRRVEQFEFSICFSCDLGEFWDNNNGLNYTVQAEELGDSSKTEASIMRDSYTSLDGNVAWSSFSYWKIGDDERPYW